MEGIRIEELRGIKSLFIRFGYPVSVLAGPNGCGKSTVLFALACAYKNTLPEAQSYTPSKLFPGFRPTKSGLPTDDHSATTLVYDYLYNKDHLQMRWSHANKKWNRSFFGRKQAAQPKRQVYLRTLTNLSNPSEVRSVLQLARGNVKLELIDTSNIAFAQRILHYRYNKLSILSEGIKNILFAERAHDEEAERTGVSYSEFHMSAGERAVLRLSVEISKLENALILIDEVETGLHPYIQQQLMLEFQRLALRNKLQVVVTTHSPVILDTVPPEARLFLERTQGNVVLQSPYRDVIQRSLYGRSQDALTLLCEDEIAESVLRGILDYLSPKLNLVQNDVQIGRDTGKTEFLSHARAFAKYKRLQNTVFVLDGDGKDIGNSLLVEGQNRGQAVTVLYLPGYPNPEAWAWNLLKTKANEYGEVLGIPADTLQRRIVEIDDTYSNAADRSQEIAKNKLYSLCSEELGRPNTEVVRLISRKETEQQMGEISELSNSLEEAINTWRLRQD